MSLRDHLHLASVTVTREVLTADGMGGATASTTTATIARAAIWSPTQRDAVVSDKIAKEATHILAIETGAYTFSHTASANDTTVTYGAVAYRLVGPVDDVALQGKLTLHGMERIT